MTLFDIYDMVVKVFRWDNAINLVLTAYLIINLGMSIKAWTIRPESWYYPFFWVLVEIGLIVAVWL